jgi:hypothetical protein
VLTRKRDRNYLDPGPRGYDCLTLSKQLLFPRHFFKIVDSHLVSFCRGSVLLYKSNQAVNGLLGWHYFTGHHLRFLISLAVNKVESKGR